MSKAEQAVEGRGVISTLHGVCFSSCLQVPSLLEFLPWQHSVMGCDMELQVKPFAPQVSAVSQHLLVKLECTKTEHAQSSEYMHRYPSPVVVGGGRMGTVPGLYLGVKELGLMGRKSLLDLILQWRSRQ